MGNTEIKIIGVIITVMILLSFTQAQSNNKIDVGVGCKIKCFLKCNEERFPKPNCMSDCESHCSELLSNTVYNCITSCRLMKSIAINIGMYSQYIYLFSRFYNFSLYLISLIIFFMILVIHCLVMILTIDFTCFSGAHDLMNNVVNTCLQECGKKL